MQKCKRQTEKFEKWDRLVPENSLLMEHQLKKFETRKAFLIFVKIDFFLWYYVTWYLWRSFEWFIFNGTAKATKKAKSHMSRFLGVCTILKRYVSIKYIVISSPLFQTYNSQKNKSCSSPKILFSYFTLASHQLCLFFITSCKRSHHQIIVLKQVAI